MMDATPGQVRRMSFFFLSFSCAARKNGSAAGNVGDSPPHVCFIGWIKVCGVTVVMGAGVDGCLSKARTDLYISLCVGHIIY